MWKIFKRGGKTAPFETVEKVAKPLFRARMHAGQSSISCEKVGLSCVRSVISAAHVGGNDGLIIYSAVCGRRNFARCGVRERCAYAARAHKEEATCGFLLLENPPLSLEGSAVMA